MVRCTIDAIKETTNIHVNTFILLFFFFPFLRLRYDIYLHGHLEGNYTYLYNLCHEYLQNRSEVIIGNQKVWNRLLVLEIRHSNHNSEDRGGLGGLNESSEENHPSYH